MSADWPTVKLGKYCTKIGSGATPRGGSSVYFDSGEIALIRSQNVYNDGFNPEGLVYIDEEAAQKLNNVTVEAGDVLLNITGDSVARVCLAKNEFLPARVNQHVAIIRPNLDEFDPRYLRYFLASPKMQDFLLTLAGAGATRYALTKGMIEVFEIPKPDVDVQKNIADILESFDDKIVLNRQINQTLEQIAQTIFKSWFVDFEPVKAKIEAKATGRDPERAAMCAISGKLEPELAQLPPEQYQQLAATTALFPDELVESELGLIPVGWEVKTLAETVQLTGGGTPKRSNSEFWGGDIPWFSVQDAPADGDVFVVDTEEKITKIGLVKSSTRLLPVGTTIISARGTVGRLALIGVEMAMNQSCYGVEGANGVGPYFNYFNLKGAVSILQQNTHGAVFDTITRQTFETVSCVKPTKLVVEHFEVIVAPLMRTICSNVRERRTLATLRDSLLPKLLSGVLTVENQPQEVTA